MKSDTFGKTSSGRVVVVDHHGHGHILDDDGWQYVGMPGRKLSRAARRKLIRHLRRLRNERSDAATPRAN